MDTVADHDKYLYDMSDFVRGVAPEEADSGFRPPVPADPSNPALAIETCLTIDARCVGEPLGSVQIRLRQCLAGCIICSI